MWILSKLIRLHSAILWHSFHMKFVILSIWSLPKGCQNPPFWRLALWINPCLSFCPSVIPSVCPPSFRPDGVFWPFLQNDFKNLSNFLHGQRGELFEPDSKRCFFCLFWSFFQSGSNKDPHNFFHDCIEHNNSVHSLSKMAFLKRFIIADLGLLEIKYPGMASLRKILNPRLQEMKYQRSSIKRCC